MLTTVQKALATGKQKEKRRHIWGSGDQREQLLSAGSGKQGGHLKWGREENWPRNRKLKGIKTVKEAEGGGAKKLEGSLIAQGRLSGSRAHTQPSTR